MIPFERALWGGLRLKAICPDWLFHNYTLWNRTQSEHWYVTLWYMDALEHPNKLR